MFKKIFQFCQTVLYPAIDKVESWESGFPTFPRLRPGRQKTS